MKSNSTTCDPHRVELFLQQKLSDDEQTAFELHLDDCHDCRRRLETAAAADDAWSAVRDSLRDPPMLPSPSGRGGEGEDEPDDDSALDYVANEEASSGPATIVKLLAPTDDDRMIGRWGTYEVVGVVGTGGMGVVLKAFDAALNRYVAIKILAPHLGTSGAAIKRFAREAKAAAAVVHDNVIEIYGVSEAAGLPYLVMPYVRGPSLQRRLNDEGPLAVVEILRVAMQAAAGLAAAHAQGLVHRDVKPANILLADGIERVKLTDFGLARAADDASLTKTGVIAGTPQYMSPEQARGEPVDPRSDLFSLGSVLYAMCTGRPPFRAETSYGVLRRITDEEPRPIREINPDIPDWLCGIVARLMAKRPDDRFQSAHEVAALLEQCLAHVQQPTVVPLPIVAGTLRVPSAPNSPPLPGEGQGVRVMDSPRLSGEGQGVRAAANSLRSRKSLLKGTLAMLTLLGISLFAVGVVSTNPPDISGKWQGEGWGQVALTQTAPGEYTGTYTDTVAKEKGPGKIDLKWSRIERRYNGTWREGKDDRFGELSVRFADKEICGALTTDAKSKINPATPPLADVTWTRIKTVAEEEHNGHATGTAGTAEESAKLAIEQIDIGKDKVVVKGHAPAGARISFYAGERSNGFACAFPKSTRFTATLQNDDAGLSCRVVPDDGDAVLALVGAKQIGSVVLSDGHFEFRPRGVHKESDGAQTATIGKWVTTSGREVPIGVTLTPPQAPTIPHSSALQFNGTSAYVDLGRRLDFRKDSTFSVAFWMKSPGPNDGRGQQAIVGNGAGFFKHNAPGWTVFVAHAGYIYFQLHGSGTHFVNELQAWHIGTCVRDGRWHHVVVTYNGNQDLSGVVIYIDGAAKSLGSDSNNLRDGDTRSNLHATVGAAPGSNDNFYQGALSELLIFDRVITRDEVAKLYANGAVNYGAVGVDGLIAGYHLNEGLGTTVADFSGRGNNGTLHGGVMWAGSTGRVIPPSLPPGSRYQLLLITGGSIRATSSDINVYNDFAAAQITNPALTSLGASWKALVSTPSVSARKNAPTSTLPIYNTRGQLIALNSSDLWDSTISTSILDQYGQSDQRLAWTGTSPSGESYFGPWSLGGGGGFGGVGPHVAVVGAGAGGGDLGTLLDWRWVAAGLLPWTEGHPVFALSTPITVVTREKEKAQETLPPHHRAIQFDGNYYAKVEPPPKFTSGDFSISLWLNPVRSGDWAYPFMRGFCWRDQRGDIGLQFNVDSGKLGFEARTADNDWLFGWGQLESRLRGAVHYGQWNHVVVTRHGDTYTMWMNGARAGSEKSAADISDADNTNPFIVGGFTYKQGVGTMYQGALDDFRIFRRCLSDKEIGELYKSSGDEAALKGEGRMKVAPLSAVGANPPETGRTQETQWTPENIKKDPVGYLTWAIDQTDATKTRLEAAQVALTKQRRDLRLCKTISYRN